MPSKMVPFFGTPLRPRRHMEPAAAEIPLEVVVEDAPAGPALSQDEEIHLSLLGSPAYSLPRAFFEARAHALPPDARRAAERGERLLLFKYQVERLLAEAEPDTPAAGPPSLEVWLEVARAIARRAQSSRRACGLCSPGPEFGQLISRISDELWRLGAAGRWFDWEVHFLDLFDALYRNNLRTIRREAGALVAAVGEEAALAVARKVEDMVRETIAGFRP